MSGESRSENDDEDVRIANVDKTTSFETQANSDISAANAVSDGDRIDPGVSSKQNLDLRLRESSIDTSESSSAKQRRTTAIVGFLSGVNKSGTDTGDDNLADESSRPRRRTLAEAADHTLHAVQHAAEDAFHEAFHAPSAKYAWNDEHTKIFRQGGHLEENWLPEFLDLILVAGLIKLGDGLHYCGLHSEELFFVGVEFLIIFSTRYMIDEFMWHFYLDDVWNQLCFFIFIIGIFIMTKMVSYSMDEITYECSMSVFHLTLFFTGLLITRVVLTMFWMVELMFDQDARDLYYMYPLRNLATMCLCLAGIILLNVDEDLDLVTAYALLGGVIFIEYYFHFYKALHSHPLVNINRYWPLSILGIPTHDHDRERLFECDEELETVQTRCGVFILIVLGESMIQLLIPSFDLEHKDGMVFLTITGLTLVWLVAKQFFDAAQRVPHDHALRRCMQSGNQWIVMHAVSGWFAFILGIGLKFLYADLRYEADTNMEHIIFMSVGCFGTVGCFTFMRFLHKGWGSWPSNRPRLLGYLLRFMVALLHLSVAYWGVTRSEHIVLCHTCIAALLTSLDLYNYKVEHVLADAFEDNDSDYGGGSHDHHDGPIRKGSSPSRTAMEASPVDLTTGSLSLDRSDSNSSLGHIALDVMESSAEGSSSGGTPSRNNQKTMSRENSYARLNNSSSNIHATSKGSNSNLMSRDNSYTKLHSSSSNVFGSSSNIFDLLKERRERGANKGKQQGQVTGSGLSSGGEKRPGKGSNNGNMSPAGSVVNSRTPSRAASSSNIFADAVSPDGTLDMDKVRARLTPSDSGVRVLLDKESNDEDVIRVTKGAEPGRKKP